MGNRSAATKAILSPVVVREEEKARSEAMIRSLREPRAATTQAIPRRSVLTTARQVNDPTDAARVTLIRRQSE